jgi:hypothetical protein
MSKLAVGRKWSTERLAGRAFAGKEFLTGVKRKMAQSTTGRRIRKKIPLWRPVTRMSNKYTEDVKTSARRTSLSFPPYFYWNEK